MKYYLSERSLQNLVGVHPDLVAVAKRAIELSKVDFVIIDGLRTVTEQKKHMTSGASKTMRSRHLTGHAIDVAAWVDGKISFDYNYFPPIADAMKVASLELKAPIIWGGDWQTFKDAGHFELDKRKYP